MENVTLFYCFQSIEHCGWAVRLICFLWLPSALLTSNEFPSLQLVGGFNPFEKYARQIG